MNFIQNPYGDGKIVNLDNVSSVGVKTNHRGRKVIFNFAHSITLDSGKMIADYDYWHVDTDENVDKVVQTIKDNMPNAFISSDFRHYIVNGDNVANIVFDDSNNRVIFNLNFSKEVRVSGAYTLSSDFTYWDFDSSNEYERAKTEIFKRIK